MHQHSNCLKTSFPTKCGIVEKMQALGLTSGLECSIFVCPRLLTIEATRWMPREPNACDRDVNGHEDNRSAKRVRDFHCREKQSNSSRNKQVPLFTFSRSLLRRTSAIAGVRYFLLKATSLNTRIARSRDT